MELLTLCACLTYVGATVCESVGDKVSKGKRVLSDACATQKNILCCNMSSLGINM